MSTQTLDMEKVKLLAPDLRDGKEYPRSPRAKLGGYVLAARVVDKCRAVLAGTEGEYHSNCPLDRQWFDFTEVDYDAFREVVATGAGDQEMVAWITENARKRPPVEVVLWNNRQRDQSLRDLPPELQEFMEGYIAEEVPRHKIVYRYFDIFDLEEERL